MIFSAAFSIGRRCGGGSIRCFSMAARFAPWPRIPNRDSPPPPPPRISRVPHLMLSSHNNPQIHLFDLELGDGNQPVIKLHREICMPEIAGRRSIGSSHGFVFALLVRGLDLDDVIVAVNPLSGDKLRLPPIHRDLTEPRSERQFARLRSKVTLSPSLDFAFLLRRTSVITGCAYFARLTPPRDDEWTLIPSPMDQFEDCAVHKGRFFAVNEIGDFTTLNDACDPSKPPRALVHISNLESKDVLHIDRKYLVESPDGDDLFLVLREEHYGYEVLLQTTRFFRVWRLDKNDNYMWKPVESLGGLAFFVGPIRCFSLPAADFPCLKPDSIYFTTDLGPSDEKLSYGDASLGDTGVFNLQDGTIRFFQLPYTMNGVDLLPPTWVAPATC